jgi:PKD repeat protein
VADAGLDIAIDQHQTATLNGTRSWDNVGLVNWTWSFVYRGRLVDLYGPSPSYLFDDAGVVKVMLTVKDGVGNTAMDNVTVDVRDITPPVADAGEDHTVGQQQTVIFDGSSSRDNVGISLWTWSFEYEDEPVKLEGTRSEFTFEESGVFVVMLTVIDHAGNRATDTVVINVTDITRPIPDAGPDLVIDQHEEARFDGTHSTDNEGIESYTWEFEEEGTLVRLSGETATYTFHEVGVFMVKLTVEDAAGNNASDEVEVRVRDIIPPSAVAGESLMIDQHTIVRLDGTGSTDNVGIVNWTWSFPYDGTSIVLTGATPTFTFDLAGICLVNLTVKDAAGNANGTTLTVTVRDTESPEAVPPGDRTIRRGAVVSLDASASTDNVGIVRWIWTFEENGKRYKLEGEVVNHTFDRSGDHEVTLTVEDLEGNTDQGTFTITVESDWWPWLLLIILVIILATVGLWARYRHAMTGKAPQD